MPTDELADVDPRRRAAVFTIVRDEPVFLPIWLRYYGATFAPEDTFVLHHVVPGELDSCCEGLTCNVEQRPNDFFDPAWLGRVVSEMQASLLRRYRVVLFAEVDEIVVPQQGTLRGLLDELADEAAPATVACTGWEMHHEFGLEPPVDLARPLLAQRGRWHRNTLYDKALITRVPLTYSLGFHTCDEPAERRDGLLLLHLHKYDFQAFLTRHEARAAMVHAPEAIANGWNAHYRATGGALMAQYLKTPAPLEPIPEWLRESLVV